MLGTVSHKSFNFFTQEVYDKEFVDRVYKLPSATLSEVLDGRVSHTEVKLQYTSKKDFEAMAKRLKIMPDLRVTVFQMPPSIIAVRATPITTFSYAGRCTQNCIQRNSQL